MLSTQYNLRRGGNHTYTHLGLLSQEEYIKILLYAELYTVLMKE